MPWISILLGLTTVIYTSSGGLKAVVLTDVIQTFILFLGAFVSIGLITFSFGGFGWFPTEWAPTWDPPVLWFDPAARVTFAGAMTMWFFWYVCTSGSDQMAVQRYLATKDLQAARSAFSLSSGLNSAGAIIAVDFFDRFSRRPLDEKAHVRRARRIAWTVGVTIVLMSLFIDRVEGNLTEVVNKIGNLLVAPLFLLFFMALFVPWANVAGTWIGAAVSVAVAVGIAFSAVFGLSFVWIMPCSLIAGILTGSLASLLLGGKKRQ